MHCLTLFLVLSVGTFVCEAKLRAAGVRLSASPSWLIRLRTSALDSVFDGAGRLSHQYIHKAPLPNVKATFGGVDIETIGARITKFDKPVIKYRLTPPNRLAGSVTFPHLGLESKFNAARRTFVSTEHDSGVAIFNASQVQVNFTALLGEFENGIPKVDSFECASFLGPANLNVKNTTRGFATDVFKVAAGTIRPFYNSQVCPTAKKLVLNKLNSLLRRLPNVLDISSKISVKYQVKPVFGADFLEARFHIKPITDVVSPFTPAKFVEADSTDSHVVVLISDALFNDVLYQVYTNELLQFKLDKNSQPILYDLIRVECQEDQTACLGNVAPALKEKFGNDATTRVVVRATKSPEVNFEQGKATFTAALTFDLFFTTANDSKEHHEATAVVDVSGAVKLRVAAKTLYGQVEVNQVKVHIDEEHNQKWEDKISGTIKRVVQDYVNGDFLSKGLPLKLPFGFGVSDPTVSFQPHTAQIHAGFGYEDSQEKK